MYSKVSGGGGSEGTGKEINHIPTRGSGGFPVENSRITSSFEVNSGAILKKVNIINGKLH